MGGRNSFLDSFSPKKGDTVLDKLMQRRSIRRYEEREPAPELIEKIVRAGQQAPFASQLYSILLSREGPHPFAAPLLFTICADIYKLEQIMDYRGWKVVSSDLALLLFAIQDAVLAAGQMVTAAESLGLGTCFLGQAPYQAQKIRQDYELPLRVFPIVQLLMGYPREDPPPRPRYPLDFVLFEDRYPELNPEQVQRAAEIMDQGYLEQNYYQQLGAMIRLEGEREEKYTLENYSWTEHISRKWGQWLLAEEEILRQMKKCGFEIGK